MSRSYLAFAMCLLALPVARASAQEFALPAASPLTAGATGVLERGVPACEEWAGPSLEPRTSLALELGFANWFGVPGLTTRAAAASITHRAAVVAAGLSQTGGGEWGWTAAALAAGMHFPGGGAALRAIARRDRDRPFAFDPDRVSWGVEAGAGGWVRAASGVRVWMSAPTLWSDGVAPPLARGLEWGVEAGGGGLRAWASHASPPLDGAATGASVAFGAGCESAAASLWVTGRDHPLRAGAGLELRRGLARVRFDAEEHPALGTTARAAIAFGSYGRSRGAIGVTPELSP